MSQDILAKITEIVEQNTVKNGVFKGEICVVSLIDEEGFPTMSTITPSKCDGINWITFGTYLSHNRAKRTLANKNASVCFDSNAYCVNLVGEMEVITSPDVKQDMWYDGLYGFFTGPDDPEYCVLKFTTKRYKYFNTADETEVEGTL
ncbi:MAG: pyridoxamine 5'-phosphate oxidase family protein [Defluviitaleaceae bacterium]|nr:pyridoxamine 5'-phosphate oxidase family protein [Defluviitaleaceae bacterium]